MVAGVPQQQCVNGVLAPGRSSSGALLLAEIVRSNWARGYARFEARVGDGVGLQRHARRKQRVASSAGSSYGAARIAKLLRANAARHNGACADNVRR